MRHKGFLSSAADACSHRAPHARRTARAQAAQSNIAGPSSFPLSGLTPSGSSLPVPVPAPVPSPSPPPIRSQPFSLPLLKSSSSTAVSPTAATLVHATKTASLSSSSSATSSPPYPTARLQRSPFHVARKSPAPQLPLSFLYPPSCLNAPRSPDSVESRSLNAIRNKSSLAPMRAVSTATAAPQLATAEDDHDHHEHLVHRLDPDFTFLRHTFDPPPPIIHHPRSNPLLEQDAGPRLDDQQPQDQLAHHVPIPFMPSVASFEASAAALASLQRQSESLRQALHSESAIDPKTIVPKCRRLVLHACRVQSKLHVGKARAVAYETVSTCALHLAASGQSVAAADIVRYLLLKMGWSPRFGSDLELPQTPLTATRLAPAMDMKATSGFGAPTAGSRLAMVAQQVISQLTLAPSTTGARPTRKFESPQHLDAATSLVSTMHLTQLPRSTASQTALVRAMIASGHTRRATETYAAEVRAWWGAHKEAKRSRAPMRRQAALVAEIGKPSSQALREITRALQHVEELLSRVPPNLLSGLSQCERQYLSSKRAEYAESLVILIRLVRGGRLPLPPVPSAPEITWILSACCRFETTVQLHEPNAQDASLPGSFDPAEKRELQTAAKVIRDYLREYMQSLPDGQTRSAGKLLIKGEPVVRPAIGIAVYNQLIHYALSVLESASICKQVFQHMTQLRQPPLQPDTVTFNTILRQATTQRYEALARAVLTTTRAEQSQFNTAEPSFNQPSVLHKQPSKGKEAPSAPASSFATPATAESAPDVASHPVKPMIEQIDAAIAQADSYRLVSLLQYVTASGLFLRRYRHEPGHVGVLELVMRIYPTLNIQRFARRHVANSSTSLWQTDERRLRPKANQASRYAILDPHVLTATLNLTAKAGKTGLALRVWRLLKRTSLQSWLQSPTVDVAKTPWKVPVAAATILMQILANEAAKMPKIRHTLRPQRLRTSRALPPRAWQRTRSKEYARGWNIAASLGVHPCAGKLRSSSPLYDTTGELGQLGQLGQLGEQGEGLRWRAAQLLAKREYAFIIHHWQLSEKLSSWCRKRVQGLMHSGRGDASATVPERASLEPDEGDDPKPDSRFYDALLNVVGLRPGMIQRSRRHVSRSEVMSQLRRGYVQAAEKAASSADQDENPTSADFENGAKLSMPAQAIGSSGNTISSRGLSSQPIAAAASDSPSQGSASDATASLGNASTNQLLQAVVSRISWNSRGRYTSLQPDPFLVRILLDMEALSLDIPVGYRWVLTHCSIAMVRDHAIPEMLHNEQGGRSKKFVGAFSPWRGPRIKTVGLIARRPNVAVATMKATAKEQKKGHT